MNFDVRRRLLDRLEQRVERALRQPVDFVDDENLVAVAHRRDRERLDDDLADGVDAGVGRARRFRGRPCRGLRRFRCTRRTCRTARAVGPFTQLSARARMRAVVVLPTPRGPAKMNDCASRPLAMRVSSACRRHRRWPMTSSNFCGRHLRASDVDRSKVGWHREESAVY